MTAHLWRLVGVYSNPTVESAGAAFECLTCRSALVLEPPADLPFLGCEGRVRTLPAIARRVHT